MNAFVDPDGADRNQVCDAAAGYGDRLAELAGDGSQRRRSRELRARHRRAIAPQSVCSGCCGKHQRRLSRLAGIVPDEQIAEPAGRQFVAEAGPLVVHAGTPPSMAAVHHAMASSDV
jgi:hypothetical protein